MPPFCLVRVVTPEPMTPEIWNMPVPLTPLVFRLLKTRPVADVLLIDPVSVKTDASTLI